MVSVTIVGAGALGSHLVLLARNWDVSLRVVDFDRVESKNTQSQFHTKMGLGKNKTVALVSALQGLWGKKMVGVPIRLDKTNIREQLRDAYLVVDCTDNFKSRALIRDHCLGAEIPCLHGCLSADGTFARVVWADKFQPDEEGEEGQATCEGGENLPFHAMAASVLAMAAQDMLHRGVERSWQLTPSSLIQLA